jgi:hypothetical protein
MGRYTGNVREMSLRHCKLSAAKAGPENWDKSFWGILSRKHSIYAESLVEDWQQHSAELWSRHIFNGSEGWSLGWKVQKISRTLVVQCQLCMSWVYGSKEFAIQENPQMIRMHRVQHSKISQIYLHCIYSRSEHPWNCTR